MIEIYDNFILFFSTNHYIFLFEWFVKMILGEARERRIFSRLVNRIETLIPFSVFIHATNIKTMRYEWIQSALTPSLSP